MLNKINKDNQDKQRPKFPWKEMSRIGWESLWEGEACGWSSGRRSLSVKPFRMKRNWVRSLRISFRQHDQLVQKIWQNLAWKGSLEKKYVNWLRKITVRLKVGELRQPGDTHTCVRIRGSRGVYVGRVQFVFLFLFSLQVLVFVCLPYVFVVYLSCVCRSMQSPALDEASFP